MLAANHHILLQTTTSCWKPNVFGPSLPPALNSHRYPPPRAACMGSHGRVCSPRQPSTSGPHDLLSRPSRGAGAPGAALLLCCARHARVTCRF